MRHTSGRLQVWTGLTRLNDTHFIEHSKQEVHDLLKMRKCFLVHMLPGKAEDKWMYDEFVRVPRYTSVLITEIDRRLDLYWANDHRARITNLKNFQLEKV